MQEFMETRLLMLKPAKFHVTYRPMLERFLHLMTFQYMMGTN